MVIPRVLSRGSVLAAQKAHFSAILSAAPDLRAVIYNSPYYGFATRADLFFELRGSTRTSSASRSSAATRTCATRPRTSPAPTTTSR